LTLPDKSENQGKQLGDDRDKVREEKKERLVEGGKVSVEIF
jgi:hypothetical protein